MGSAPSLYGQRTDRPAEVIHSNLKPAHAVVNLPVFREAIALADLASVAMTTRGVGSLDERRVDLLAHRRELEGCGQLLWRSVDEPALHVYYAALLASLVNRCVEESRRSLEPGLRRAPPGEPPRLGDFFPIGLQDRILVRQNSDHPGAITQAILPTVCE